MPKIPKGLTLDVAVEYCQQAKASPKLVDDLRKIAAEYHSRDRTFDELTERTRVEAQRAAFNDGVDAGPLGAMLIEVIVNRALDLLDGGKGEACDALLEFVPAVRADNALNEYFADQEAK